MDSSYQNITKLILQILSKINKPLESDEIAFRVRSTTSLVKEELDKLTAAHLINKQGNKYSIKEESKNSSLETLFNY